MFKLFVIAGLVLFALVVTKSWLDSGLEFTLVTLGAGIASAFFMGLAVWAGSNLSKKRYDDRHIGG